jgi:hypothetical protein
MVIEEPVPPLRLHARRITHISDSAKPVGAAPRRSATGAIGHAHQGRQALRAGALPGDP